jgi:uncharacterized cupin superfamily protein
MADVTIAHDEELERAYDMWVLVRKTLGVTSFGLNIVELPSGAAIPEHDEVDRDQEEVFAVLDGAVTLVVDGEEHPLQRGSFARLGTAPRRFVRNDGDELARVLIVSAPLSSGYEPMSWA